MANCIALSHNHLLITYQTSVQKSKILLYILFMTLQQAIYWQPAQEIENSFLHSVQPYHHIRHIAMRRLP